MIFVEIFLNNSLFMGMIIYDACGGNKYTHLPTNEIKFNYIVYINIQENYIELLQLSAIPGLRLSIEIVTKVAPQKFTQALVLLLIPKESKARVKEQHVSGISVYPPDPGC